MATSPATLNDRVLASQDSLNDRTEGVKSSVQPQLQNFWKQLPDKGQVQGMFSWVVTGLTVVTVGGVIFAGGAVFLAVVTPSLVFLSAILLPVGSVLFLVTAVVLVSVGLALGTILAFVWVYRYVKRDEPVHNDRVDAAKNRIAGTSGEVKKWPRDRVP